MEVKGDITDGLRSAPKHRSLDRCLRTAEVLFVLPEVTSRAEYTSKCVRLCKMLCSTAKPKVTSSSETTTVPGLIISDVNFNFFVFCSQPRVLFLQVW